MNVIVKRTGTNKATLIPLSDLHGGHVDFDEAYLKEVIAWIVKNRAYTILLGDIIDGIGKRDRRFENSSIAPQFYQHLDNLHYEQVKYILNLLEPLRGTGLPIGILTGNHETTVKKQFGYDATLAISEALEIPIMTDPGYVVLALEQGGAHYAAKIWCSHGCFLGGRYMGAKVNALKRVAEYFPTCDIYMAGHTHDKWVIPGHFTQLTKNFHIEEKCCYFANTGAFLRTYREKDQDTWASRSVFAPQVPGVVRFDFRIKKKNQKRYLDIQGRTKNVW